MKNKQIKLSEFEEVMIYSSSCREIARNHREEFKKIKQRKTREATNRKLKSFLNQKEKKWWKLSKYFALGEKDE